MQRTLVGAILAAGLISLGCQDQTQQPTATHPTSDREAVAVPVPVPIPVDQEGQATGGAGQDPGQQGDQMKQPDPPSLGNPLVGRVVGTPEGQLIVQDNRKYTYTLHVPENLASDVKDLSVGDNVSVGYQRAERGMVVTKIESSGK